MVNEGVIFNKAALKLCRNTLGTCQGLIDGYAGFVSVLIVVLPVVDDQRNQQTGGGGNAGLVQALQTIQAALDRTQSVNLNIDGQTFMRFFVKLLSGHVMRDGAAKAELLEGLDLAS